MDFIYEENRIYLNDASGKMIAEITFPSVSDGVVDIDHTFVDSSLRGQGVADKLIRAAMEKIRKEGWSVIPSCSYAEKWFGKNPDQADVLQPSNNQ
ncbi:MAG: GNAT family N-acetyltransferase [Christensenellaceae bacterium]|jgi:predicted GNAT family acetyltransferase